VELSKPGERTHRPIELMKMFIHLLIKWGYSETDFLTEQICEEFSEYLTFMMASESAYVRKTSRGAKEYWSHQEKFPELKVIVLRILSIPVHAASVERLFSLLGLVKTKYRNRMNTSTLENIAATKLHLIEELRQDGRIKEVKKVDHRGGDTLDAIQAYNEISFEEDEDDPEDIIGKLIIQDPSEVQELIADMWVETFFDLEIFEASYPKDEEQQPKATLSIRKKKGFDPAAYFPKY